MPARKKGAKGGKAKGKGGGPPKKKKGGQSDSSRHTPSVTGSASSSSQSGKIASAASIALRKQRDSILEDRYAALTGAAHMTSFFGIFTKHNLQIYQVLTQKFLSESLNKLNGLNAAKFVKSLDSTKHRDLNQYIYHGDNVVGCLVCEMRMKDKTLLIKGVVILPHFRNFGFGSRLMVNLLKAVDTRTNIDTVSTSVPIDCDPKVISFFAKFGLVRVSEESKSDGTEDRITLELQVKSMKESIGEEVIESLKAAKQATV